MKTFRNITMMLLVNLGIMLTLSFVLRITGLDQFMYGAGAGYGSLALFCLFWGMGGALISLLLSKKIVKWTMGVKTFGPGEGDSHTQKLYEILTRVSTSAQLKKVPEFGVYESPEMNAFATGPSESNSLVAVSTGLMQQMTDSEIEGVIAHEVAHIKNGDMVTMTLIQGIVNALVMFLARIIAFAVANTIEKESQRYWVRFAVIMVCEIVLGLLGVMFTAWFSRRREFRADAGGAKYSNPQKMLAALEALQRRFEPLDNRSPQLAAFKISTGRKGGFLSLISTHPPLEDRIAALKTYSQVR